MNFGVLRVVVLAKGLDNCTHNGDELMNIGNKHGKKVMRAKKILMNLMFMIS